MATAFPASEHEGPVSVDELTALALAADPDLPLDPHAVPLQMGALTDGLLPDWYMPAPARATHKIWHQVLVVAAIAGFAAINAFGLCITYGYLTVA